MSKALLKWSHEFSEKVDISNYAELVECALEYQFPEWDIPMAFNFKTLEYDESNKEVSIELITV